MGIAKEWDWENAEKKGWLTPCPESHYYAVKWYDEGKRTLLDLGAGLGRHTVFFAKKGFDVTAVDLSEFALSHLSEWCKREKIEVKTQLCNMLSLPFPDNSFDCIFAYHVLSHTDTEGEKKMFSEIHRVLKPNGKIFFDICSKDSPTFHDENNERFDDNTVIVRGGEEDGIPHFFTDERELRELLKDFEFESLRYVNDIFHNGKWQVSQHYYAEIVKR